MCHLFPLKVPKKSYLIYKYHKTNIDKVPGNDKGSI